MSYHQWDFQFCVFPRSRKSDPSTPNDSRAPWTLEKIEAIAKPYLESKKKELGIESSGATLKFLSSEVWGDYVNHHHFVNIQTEGVPEGYKFEYSFKMDDFWNLPEGKSPRGLPTAEIVETGEFYYWWEKYNYYALDEKKTTDHIHLVIDHELYHYLQWQRIVSNAMVMGGCIQNTNDNHSPVMGIKIPSTLSQLREECGNEIVDSFMKVWSDPAHYQCREVEVYSTQVEQNQVQTIGKDVFVKFLKNLKNYLKGEAGNPYSIGCENSMWKAEFMPYVLQANQQLLKNADLLKK